MGTFRTPIAAALSCAYLVALAPCPPPVMPSLARSHAVRSTETAKPADPHAHHRRTSGHAGHEGHAAHDDVATHASKHAPANATEVRPKCSCGCGDKAPSTATGGRLGPALPSDSPLPPIEVAVLPTASSESLALPLRYDGRDRIPI